MERNIGRAVNTENINSGIGSGKCTSLGECLYPVQLKGTVTMATNRANRKGILRIRIRVRVEIYFDSPVFTNAT